MNVIAYTALHYGKSYLRWAIRSIIDHVDALYVLYSPIGSHGSRTEQKCPETRAELMAEAMLGAGKKLKWYDGAWPREADQRNAIYEIAPQADIIYVLDADEIWPTVYANCWRNIIQHCKAQGKEPFRHYRFPMIHYWRSFRKAVINDPAFPTRLIFTRTPNGEDTFWAEDDRGFKAAISHFGYAQPADIVAYKQLTHGHRAEWRKDINWFQDRYLANAQADCHPVGINSWTPVTVDPNRYLPKWMAEHPFAELDVIP